MDKNENLKQMACWNSSKAWDYSDVRAYGFHTENETTNRVEVYSFYLKELNPECTALFHLTAEKKWRAYI